MADGNDENVAKSRLKSAHNSVCVVTLTARRGRQRFLVLQVPQY